MGVEKFMQKKQENGLWKNRMRKTNVMLKRRGESSCVPFLLLWTLGGVV